MENRILELRKKKKVSQGDVAKALNVTRAAISLYEMGKREPKLETWQKLADFFDVPIAYLQGTTSYIKNMNYGLALDVKNIFLLRKNQSIVHIAEAQNDYAMMLWDF